MDPPDREFEELETEEPSTSPDDAGVLGKTVRVSAELEELDYEAWTTQIVPGPLTWTGETEDDTHGRQYIAVVTTSEIYSGLHVQFRTFGLEGCCAQIEWSRRLGPLFMEFADAFDIRGEISGLVVDEWLDETVFDFTLHNRRFRVTVGDADSVTVSEVN